MAIPFLGNGLMKKKTLTTVLVVLLAIFLILNLPSLAAMGVMGVYSAQNVKDDEKRHEEEGLKRVEVKLPGGLSTFKRDYFPFVMTFCDTGFGSFVSDRNYTLTILYNFGAFEPFKFHSSLFSEDSLYYNSFYGAYLVTDTRDKDKVRPYGLKADGTIDAEAVAKVPEYDFYRLVLSDFGLSYPDFEFDWNITDIAPADPIDGSDGWQRIDAELNVSGAKHQMKEFTASYLQYGYPIWPIEGEAFESVSMKGVLFFKYFPEQQTGVYLYALCCDSDTLEAAVENYLIKAEIK